jgi:DNA polymerase III subunit epsilon
MYQQDFAIVDVETTGGHPVFHRVIEIGILRVEKGEVVRTYKTLVNPEQPIPEWITNITGLRDEDVKDAPTFEEIKDEVLEMFEDAVFVAHNASFDYSFLRGEFARFDTAFNLDSLCTVRLSRTLFPGFRRHNLTEIIERFNFDCTNRHRAFDDAKVLWDFLQMLPTKFPQEQVDLAIKRTMKKIAPSRQRKMKPDSKQDLTYEPIVEQDFFEDTF